METPLTCAKWFTYVHYYDQQIYVNTLCLFATFIRKYPSIFHSKAKTYLNFIVELVRLYLIVIHICKYVIIQLAVRALYGRTLIMFLSHLLCNCRCRTVKSPKRPTFM